MKIYLADTNFYLRFLLDDNKLQSESAKKYLEQAKEEKIRIIYLSLVIVEMEVILRRVYNLPKLQICQQLLSLVKTPYLRVEDQGVWIQTLERFEKVGMDLVDLFLFTKSQEIKAEILSFDKKLLKLK